MTERRQTDAEGDDDRVEDAEAILEAIDPGARRSRVPGLIRSGAVVAVAVALSNLLNVVFQLATARFLPPAEYSLLVTLFSILLIASVPILSLQARVAREVARSLAEGRVADAGVFLVESLRPLARWGLIVFAAGVAIAVPLAFIFNIDRELPLAAAAVAVLVTLPMPIAMGGLQGSERFALLGAAQFLYASLKVAIGIGLAALGFGAAAIILGIAVATVVTFMIALIPLRPMLRSGLTKARHRIDLFDEYTRGAALILILIAALTNLDLIAARLFLAEDVAGDYAAVSVAARSLLLLPIVATTVLFPRVATLRDLTAERGHLLGGLSAVGLLAVVPLALFFAIPEQLIEIGFGSDYVAGSNWLGPLGVAMLLYALVEVYMFHFLALGRLRYGAVLGVGFAVQLVLFAFLHGDPDQIIAVQIATSALLLVASELFDRVNPSPEDRVEPPETAPATGAPG